MIDWDIDDENRQDMIRYVEQKYGRDNVSQIITFGSYAARAAVRAAGRCLGVEYDIADRVAKMIPKEIGITLDEAITYNKDLRQAMDSDIIVRELMETAMAFEGLPSDTGTHAAGVIIAPHKLSDHMPMWANRSSSKSKKNGPTIVSQADMDDIDTLGYLKMDFLGLNALTVIGDTKKLVKKNHGVDIDYLRLMEGKYTTPEAYTLIANGDTEGLFQLEGSGMTSTAMNMKPKDFKELTALISLYRPGPMDFIPTYIRNKEDPSRIVNEFKEITDILAETHGVLVYQEQVKNCRLS